MIDDKKRQQKKINFINDQNEKNNKCKCER